MIRIVRLGFLAVLVVGLLGLQPAQAAARVRIDRIYFDSPGSDTRSNQSLNNEWIRLENRGDRSRNIQGWTVRDRVGHTYAFGRRILEPGAIVYLHTGRGGNTTRHRYWGMGNYVWNNDGDEATLKNAQGQVVDRCGYDGSGDYSNC